MCALLSMKPLFFGNAFSPRRGRNIPPELWERVIFTNPWRFVFVAAFMYY